MTRQEKFGVPFIASEYAFLLLEKCAFMKFYNEIEWQKKHYGIEYADNVLNYIEKNRIVSLPGNMRPIVKEFVDTVKFIISPYFKEYVREKYFSDMPYPRLF
ncbi:MAG: hypothetical protein WA139_00845 [Candidatus Aenigmatarchaeota archaeon]